ncbi:hypothetical protein Scep_014887 [Stephania cephalantha]|uniref:Uncharacterized protein n=1 Tax=Stephania cephalantha TaxID=152367 RepID=A0AAP0P3F6_9MAGN
MASLQRRGSAAERLRRAGRGPAARLRLRGSRGGAETGRRGIGNSWTAAIGSGDCSATPAATRLRRWRGSTAAARWQQRWCDSYAGSGAVTAVARLRRRRGERRGGSLSDRSLLDEGCDSTNFDDAMEGLRGDGVRCRVRISRRERDVLRTIRDFSIGSIGKRVMVTVYLRYELLSGRRRYLPIECTLGALIRVCGYLIVARVRVGRQMSRPKLESAGILPRLNDL